MNRERRLMNGLAYLTLAVFSILSLIPFIWMVSTAFKIQKRGFFSDPAMDSPRACVYKL